MSEHLAHALEGVINAESVGLRALTEEQAATRPKGPQSWSRKEELGHLIDSAVNNHARFVRASLEPEFRGLGYDQEGWVRAHGYHDLPWPELISSWEQHNRLLLHVVRRIPEDRLETPCFIGTAPAVDLRFLIEDYIAHMQHHLDHILSRETITQYPGAALGV